MVSRTILLAFAAVATVAAVGARAAEPLAVPTVAVGSAGRDAGFEVDGSLQAVRQSTLGAQVGGNVVQLAVKAGDRVKAGQLLVRIDERDVQAGLAQREAALVQAEAEQRNAKVNAERTRELRRQGFVSQAALDVAETQLQGADAGVRQAQAARAQAALARGFAAVTAPFDAVVLATLVDAGDLATPGRPLVTVYAPGAIRAVVQLPGSRSLQARAASAVEVTLPDGRRVAPVARTELPGADAVSQTVEWRFDLPPAAAAGLVPGQNVRVHFAGAGAGAAAAAPSNARPTVPAAAVLRRGELTAVYVQRGEGFVLQAVRTGAAVGDAVEVLAGLKAGDRIAADAVRAGLEGAVAAK